MGFIEKFNKQATITKLSKTPLYKEIEEHKNLLNDHKIEFKVKQEMDLFLYEVIYRSFYNEWCINRAWDDFRGEYYDTFNYINYEEKQKMFNNDLAPVLAELPHFHEKTSDLEIYLPQYEPEINRWFIQDYSLTTLKQHAEKIKNMAINPHTPLDLYGINMFNTNFSSLEKVYDQDGFLAYFFKDQDMIFILEKASLDLVNRIYLSMPKVESKIEIEDVKTLCAFFMDEKNKDVLDYMLEKGLMNEKVHKKLSKLIKE